MFERIVRQCKYEDVAMLKRIITVGSPADQKLIDQMKKINDKIIIMDSKRILKPKKDYYDYFDNKVMA